MGDDIYQLALIISLMNFYWFFQLVKMFASLMVLLFFF
ncbi:hypothetical protein BN132_1877 [Cronobacter turicensis 564]|nr:hypothetical protein BN132_1877 [Cronobacter turicensis 564]